MTNRSYNFQRSSTTGSKQYKAWILNCHVVNSRMHILSPVDHSGILSFSVANSTIAIKTNLITKLVFSIILYSAIKYCATFTAMVNIQEVLQLRDISCGSLWSDKRVYRLANKFQLNHQRHTRKDIHTGTPYGCPNSED